MNTDAVLGQASRDRCSSSRRLAERYQRGGTSMVHLDCHNCFLCTLYRSMYETLMRMGDTHTAVRICSTRQEGNSTTSEASPKSRNLVWVGKVMKTGHRQGGGVEGWSSGVVGEIHIRRFGGFWVRADTHIFRISGGEAFRSFL